MDSTFSQCSQGVWRVCENCILAAREKNFFYNGSNPLFFCKTRRKMVGFWEGREIWILGSGNGPWAEIREKRGVFEDQPGNWRGTVVLVTGADGKNEVARRKIIFLFTRKAEMPYL
jgi:hypothetical protein